jgi:hypothetical protein
LLIHVGDTERVEPQGATRIPLRRYLLADGSFFLRMCGSKAQDRYRSDTGRDQASQSERSFTPKETLHEILFLSGSSGGVLPRPWNTIDSLGSPKQRQPLLSRVSRYSGLTGAI